MLTCNSLRDAEFLKIIDAMLAWMDHNGPGYHDLGWND